MSNNFTFAESQQSVRRRIHTRNMLVLFYIEETYQVKVTMGCLCI